MTPASSGLQTASAFRSAWAHPGSHTRLAASMLIGVLLLFVMSPVGAQSETPLFTPSTQETVRTPGGMEVTFPASYFVTIDSNSPNMLTLTNLEPGAQLTNLRIQDLWDTWEHSTTPTLTSARDELLAMLRLIGTPSDAAPEYSLPNGRLIVIPYTLDASNRGGLYALLALPNARILVAEILVDDQAQLAALLQDPQQWLSILSSVHFTDAAPTAVSPRQIPLDDRPLTWGEMPPSTIVFVSDVVLPLDTRWLPTTLTSQADEVVEDAVTLAYNGAEALAVIRVSHLDGISFVDWRNSVLMVMGDALLDGAEPASSAAYIREDGRTVEQYSSHDLAISLFFVDLGEGTAAYVLATMVPAEETRRLTILEALRALLLQMTRFERQ